MTQATRSRSERRSAATPRRILVAAVAAQCGISFAEQGVPTLSVFLKQDLSLSAAAAGGAVAALGLGRIMGFYLAGLAVDRRGERRMLLVGAVGAGASVAISAAFPYAGMLVVLLVAGLFLALATPAGGKLVFTAFPDHRRGLAMGIRQAGVPLGGMAAAAVLPVVAGVLDWRTAFVLAGLVSIAGGLVAVALAGLGPRVERSEVHTTRSIRPFLTREFVLVTLWACPLVGGQYALLTFFAIDAHARTGISTGAAAALVLVLQVGGMAGRVVWGALADALPERHTRALFGSLTGIAIGSVLALALVPGQNVATFVVIGLVAGLTVNGWQGVFMSRLTVIAGAARAGAATGLSLTFLGLSFTVSTPVYGAIADVAGTARAIWFALAAMLGISAIAAALIGTGDAG